MQKEYKVIRLELQAIHVHYSYLMDEMAPDQLVPHMVQRKLISLEKANSVMKMSSQLLKCSAILEALKDNNIVGRLPTFCVALNSAGLPHIAVKLTDSETQLTI